MPQQRTLCKSGGLGHSSSDCWTGSTLNDAAKPWTCFRVHNAEYVTSKAQEWGHPLHEALTGWGKELAQGNDWIAPGVAPAGPAAPAWLWPGHWVDPPQLRVLRVSGSERSSGARACVAALVAIGPDRPGIMKPA